MSANLLYLVTATPLIYTAPAIPERNKWREILGTTKSPKTILILKNYVQATPTKALACQNRKIHQL